MTWQRKARTIAAGLSGMGFPLPIDAQGAADPELLLMACQGHTGG